MTLEIKKNINETTIKIVGRLDIITAPVLEKMINHSASTAKSIVLELSGLEYISDAGIRAIFDSREKIKATCSLRIIGVGEGIRGILKSNGFSDALAIN